MAATIEIQVGHGAAPGSFATKTSMRFKSADNDTADLNNPLVKPTTGNTTYSFEKWLRLWCSAPPSNVVNNIRFHRAAGTPSTGISDYYGERSQAEDYEQPIGTLSSYATTAVPTSATALTEGTGDNGADETQYGPFVVLQWRLADTVSPGNLATVTYRYTYDET